MIDRSRDRTALAASVRVVVRLAVPAALAATVVAACGRPPLTTPERAPGVEVAPYVDLTLDVVPDLTQAVRNGLRMVNLGFVTAQAGRCRPAWGGTVRYDDVAATRRVGEVRAAGGEARIAFGGESGTDLALACRTPSELARAYAVVVGALGVTQVDLDVEGTGLQDRDAVHRRNLAVRLMQQAAGRAGHVLRVSYTLPAQDDGLVPAAQELLRDAQRTGVEVDVVNAMTMDLGTSASDLATASASAAVGVEAFVRRLRTGPAAGTSAWGTIAVTPMIGRNDVPSEIFGLDDAERLVAFARAHHLARLSFWSLNRDRPCAAGTAAVGGAGAAPGCSGVPQRPGDFTAAFTRGAGTG